MISLAARVFFLAGLVLLYAVPAQAGSSTVGSGGNVTDLTASLLLIAVVIGAVYNLARTTRVYGGIIGEGLRRIGLGIIFITIEALDRIAASFGSSGVVTPILRFLPEAAAHDLLLLLGLFFAAAGFVRMQKALKV